MLAPTVIGSTGNPGAYFKPLPKDLKSKTGHLALFGVIAVHSDGGVRTFHVSGNGVISEADQTTCPYDGAPYPVETMQRKKKIVFQNPATPNIPMMYVDRGRVIIPMALLCCRCEQYFMYFVIDGPDFPSDIQWAMYRQVLLVQGWDELMHDRGFKSPWLKR